MSNAQKRQSPLLIVPGDKVHIPGVTAKPLLVEQARQVRWHTGPAAWMPVPAGQGVPDAGTIDAALHCVELTVWPHDPDAYGQHIMFSIMVGVDQGVLIYAAAPAPAPYLRSVR